MNENSTNSLSNKYEQETNTNPYTTYHHCSGPTQDYVNWLESHINFLKTENSELSNKVAKYEQPPFPKCEGCTYLKKPFPPHCMRGEDDTYCIHKQEATDVE